MQVDDLTITREKTQYVVSDGERQFTIDIATVEPSQDWFCSYETIRRILLIVKADLELTE